MINLPGLAELQQMISALEASLSRVLSLGDPGQVAGDPASIRTLAAVHRRAASALRTVQEDGQSLAAGVTGGDLWEGRASGGFIDFWVDVNRRIDGVASGHDRLASSLEGIAAESARFNPAVSIVTEDIRSWLAEAPSAVLRMDSGEIAGLLGKGRDLLPNLERLLGDVEQFAGRMVQDMSIDLDFTRRQVDKMMVQPLGPHVIKDPIPPPQNPRETIPIPGPKPGPDIMAIGGIALGPLITTPGDIPGLSNILRSYQPPPRGLHRLRTYPFEVHYAGKSTRSGPAGQSRPILNEGDG